MKTQQTNAWFAISGTPTVNVGDVVCESAYQAAIGNLTGAQGSGITDTDLPFVQGCIPLNVFGEGAASDPRQWPAPFTLQEGGRTDFLELDPGHFVRVAAGCKASELAA